MIDLEQARGLLARAVLTQGPDFVYKVGDRPKVCLYRPTKETDYGFDSDDPRSKTACLVGVALSLAGETRHVDIQDSVTGLSATFRDMMTDEAAKYFRRAQYRQDNGETWGIAYRDAEAIAERLIRERA